MPTPSSTTPACALNYEAMELALRAAGVWRAREECCPLVLMEQLERFERALQSLGTGLSDIRELRQACDALYDHEKKFEAAVMVGLAAAMNHSPTVIYRIINVE